jgi:hypothetical protein
MTTAADLPSRPWPALDPERLSAAVAQLAEPVADAALRAQLHSLATVISSLPAQAIADPQRPERELALAQALTAEDEPAVIAAARALAAADRAAVQSVDWSAVSGG